MTFIIYFLLLFTGLMIETTFLKIPFVLIILLVIFLRFKNQGIFFLAFVMGILLDSLNIQRLGISSLLFLLFLFCVSLYEKKYQIKTLPFVIISSFFGVLSYSYIIYHSYSIWIVTLLGTFTGVFLFLLLSKLDEDVSL